jgi:hypothetical protein
MDTPITRLSTDAPITLLFFIAILPYSFNSRLVPVISLYLEFSEYKYENLPRKVGKFFQKPKKTLKIYFRAFPFFNHKLYFLTALVHNGTSIV